MRPDTLVRGGIGREQKGYEAGRETVRPRPPGLRPAA